MTQSGNETKDIFLAKRDSPKFSVFLLLGIKVSKVSRR